MSKNDELEAGYRELEVATKSAQRILPGLRIEISRKPWGTDGKESYIIFTADNEAPDVIMQAAEVAEGTDEVAVLAEAVAWLRRCVDHGKWPSD